MTRIDEYKALLSESEATMLDGYLTSMREFITGLNTRHCLILEHSPERIEKAQRFIRTSNASLTLLNTFYDCFPTNGDTTKIDLLVEAGFDREKLGELMGSIICHSYQVSTERFKLQLITIIDFNRMGMTDADKKTLGPIIGLLQRTFPENAFIAYFNTSIRNSITHYTYYFDRGELCLCNGYFDTNPQRVTLANFMIESKKLITLVEAFLLLFLDMYAGPGHYIQG